MSVIYTCKTCGGSQMTFMRYIDEPGDGYNGRRDMENSGCRCTDYWNMEALKKDYTTEQLIELGFDLDAWKPEDDGHMLDNDDLW